MQAGVRFAPSPTGRFHIGNLRTAWIAQWWAKALGEKLIIRSDDIDHPRNIIGAHDQQLSDMKALGIVPDQIVIQSARRNRHWELLKDAIQHGVVYPCFCSRKDVQTSLSSLASAPHLEPGDQSLIYTGACRNRPMNPNDASSATAIAWRFRSADPTGQQDFIVARTKRIIPDLVSFIPAYHWACAIDDWEGKYKLLIRAWDLASAVPIQRTIQKWVQSLDQAAPTDAFLFPAVFHTSLITQLDGHRLEKRTAGVTLLELDFLGIGPTEIIKRYAKSFSELSAQFEPSKVWGEQLKTRTRDDIGL